jgi:hypothetical protein
MICTNRNHTWISGFTCHHLVACSWCMEDYTNECWVRTELILHFSIRKEINIIPKAYFLYIKIEWIFTQAHISPSYSTNLYKRDLLVKNGYKPLWCSYHEYYRVVGYCLWRVCDLAHRFYRKNCTENQSVILEN